MSNTRKAGAAKKAPPPAAVTKVEPAAPAPDDKDAEIAALKAQLEALRTPPAPEPEPEPVDPRDAEIKALRAELEAARAPADPELVARDKTIAALKAELAEIRSTPEGANAEMAKAIDALREQVERMASGKGLVPVPEKTKPDPIAYGFSLECGDTGVGPNPHASHHHCDRHGTVPVRGHWHLSDEMREMAEAGALSAAYDARAELDSFREQHKAELAELRELLAPAVSNVT